MNIKFYIYNPEVVWLVSRDVSFWSEFRSRNRLHQCGAIHYSVSWGSVPDWMGVFQNYIIRYFKHVWSLGLKYMSVVSRSVTQRINTDVSPLPMLFSFVLFYFVFKPIDLPYIYWIFLWMVLLANDSNTSWLFRKNLKRNTCRLCRELST